MCTGPFLTALAAWGVPADAAAARLLGCDQGQWTVPDAAGGHGLVLPLGERVAIQW